MDNITQQNNNAFYNFYLPKESTYFTNGYSSQKIALESWLASKADSADEIANLQRKVAELEENLAVIEDGLAADKALDRALREVDTNTIARLQAHIDTLQKFIYWECDVYLNGQNPEFSKKYKKLLDSTPKEQQ